MIPNPDLSNIPVARERTFVFGEAASQRPRPETAFVGPWGVGGRRQEARRRLRPHLGGAAIRDPRGLAPGQRRRRLGSPDSHPLRRGTGPGAQRQPRQRAGVGARPQGRLPAASRAAHTITMQFRDWGGMFMEHCHNTVHEDNAMLLRWEINDGGEPYLRPLPTPCPTPQGVNVQRPDVNRRRGARSSLQAGCLFKVAGCHSRSGGTLTMRRNISASLALAAIVWLAFVAFGVFHSVPPRRAALAGAPAISPTSSSPRRTACRSISTTTWSRERSWRSA